MSVEASDDEPAEVAVVFVRGKGGSFVAERCEVSDGLVTASGRWRWAVGPNYVESRWGPPATYSWPTHRVHEVRWRDGRE